MSAVIDHIAGVCKCVSCGQKITSCENLLQLQADDKRVIPVPSLSKTTKSINSNSKSEHSEGKSEEHSYTEFSQSQSIAINPIPMHFTFVIAGKVEEKGVTDQHPWAPAPTTENSWFQDRKHAILWCKGCGSHLGWSFTAVEETPEGERAAGNDDEKFDRFYGLALHSSRFYRNMFLLAVVLMAMLQLWWRSAEEENDLFQSLMNTILVLAAAVICILKMAPYLG